MSGRWIQVEGDQHKVERTRDYFRELVASLKNGLDVANDARTENARLLSELDAARERAERAEAALSKLENAARVIDVMINEPAFKGLTTAEDYNTYIRAAWLGVAEACDEARKLAARGAQHTLLTGA